jgi:amino acid adenylation domain-containing protein
MQARGSTRDIYALTPMQEGMFFHTLKDPGSPVYVTQVSYRLNGTVDASLVADSLSALVQRHDILRTAFVQEGLTQPFQVVLNERDLDFTYLDVRASDPAIAEEQVNDYKEKDRARCFKLDRDILMRVALIRLADDACEFVWTYHHILMDGWCVSVLVTEFYQLYKGLQTGVPPQLPEPIPYSTYVRWFEKKDKREARNYWQHYMAGVSQVTRLPETPRPGRQAAYENEDYCFRLTPGQTGSLTALAARSRVTMNSVLQTIWGVAMAKYNDTRDAVFGTVVSGRPAHIDGVERIVGLFINAVPVRVRYGADTRFVDLLKTVQQDAIDSEPNHYFPLADIQADTAVKQNLISHIFVFENHPVSNLVTDTTDAASTPAADWAVTAADGFAQTNYDFNVNVSPAGDEIVFRFDWNKPLFDRAAVIRLASQYQYLVDQVIGGEQTLVDALSLLTDTEAQRLLTLAQAPHKTALIHHTTRLSYAELGALSDRLARYLQTDLNLRQGDYVGVLLDRSAATVVSLLAIQKAGGVYVPIDPNYPDERIAFMLADTGATVLLTQSAYLSKAGHFAGLTFAVDTTLSDLADARDYQPVTQELAYVIYTSGTTGKPKGVLIRQESIIDRILYHNDYLPVTATDVVLQFASPGFDASLVEILMALFAGATVVIADSTIRQNLSLLADTIEQQGVTVAILPPAYLKILDKQPLPSLRKLISTGEAAQLEESLFYAETKDFFNGYGPTEACIGASFHQIDTSRQDDYRTNGIPIGKPFANTTILLVDSQRKLVPQGITAEICVTGKGLSAGYLNQPVLTAHAFLPNPYARNEQEAVLYHTGDLGRWNAAGELEYVGRRDEQVQINGMRVEIGEIESLLRQQDGIQQAAVTAQSDQSGQLYLIAYVVSPVPVTVASIRATLGTFLPAHMLPSWVVRLDDMPLSSNGKVNKKALPVADLSELQKLAQYESPVGDTEQRLATIWQRVLDRADIGVLDNFFQIGGQSLKATQIVSRIFKEFKAKVELNDLFSNPTIRSLAAVIDQKQPADYQKLTPAPQQAYYPLSSAQKRLWMLDQFAGTQAAYNVPGSYWLSGGLNVAAFERSFYQLIQRHESLRTRFVTTQGEPAQQIVAADACGFTVDYEDLQTASDQQAQLDRLARQYAEWPFDLQTGPLIKVKLIRTQPDTYLLLLTMHHIISDGWSIDVLVRDVFAFYRANCAGTDVGLAPLTVHYKEYTLWQSRQLVGEALEKHRNYWFGQFDSPVPPLLLPTDFARPAHKRYQGDVLTHTFAEEQVIRLKSLCQQEGITSFVALVALLNTVLHDWTGQTDIVLGSVISGRQLEQLEDQIGLYTNTIALRTRFDVQDSFMDLLQRSRQTVLGAYQYQLYPFEQLAEELSQTNPAGDTSLFSIMVTHQHLGSSALRKQTDMGGIRVESGPTKASTSRMDLVFGFVEYDNHLNLTVEYDTDLFLEASVCVLMEKMALLLAKAIASPQLPIGGFDLQDALEERFGMTTALADFDIDFF